MSSKDGSGGGMPKATAILAGLSSTWAAGRGGGSGRVGIAASMTAEAVAPGTVVAVEARSRADGVTEAGCGGTAGDGSARQRSVTGACRDGPREIIASSRSSYLGE